MLFISCADTQTNKSEQIPVDKLYPKVKVQAKELVIVDLQFNSRDAQISAVVLQGIVNRSSTKKIYVTNTYCANNRSGWAHDTLPRYPDQAQMAGLWLKELFGDIPKQVLPISKSANNPG
ncbi:hypothetical protein CLV98_101543 [Dyadobacter jejuensis]|uniref:Uncharacterized protein n=1 Tax=Dyadobacter jejuensis TaxID=1082580 RepID=A0A316ASG2_9BACT|nr:hypothetical protein [Dyadobacter jejuensis]PWJ60361.1 hypothetical protein CLV98_101543 [Dyadobacter jejuensis]